MNKVNVTTVSAVATSATAVQAVIPEYQKSKAVIRRFSALGNDAACACNFYIPKACRAFRLPVALATAGTTLRIPVDVAGGHVFKGHTLGSTDLLCLLTPTGWKVVSATYADNAQQTYCTATITAVGAIPANTVCYVVVPATDKIAGVPVIGAAQVSVEDLLSGDTGVPVIFDIVATSAKVTTAAALVEYWA